MPSDDASTKVSTVRRIEVFEAGRPRRRWSAGAKAQIVAESYAGLESVSDVARRHGLATTQLFTWRRDLRREAEPAAAPMFAPVVLEPALPAAPVKPQAKALRKTRRSRDGGIELEIDGVVVRVGRGAEAKTVAAVIHALKNTR